MLKIIGEILAKFNLGARGNSTRAATDSLDEKMRALKWAATEDDRSALKYQAEIENKARAPLAEIMTASYLGRPQEPFE